MLRTLAMVALAVARPLPAAAQEPPPDPGAAAALQGVADALGDSGRGLLEEIGGAVARLAAPPPPAAQDPTLLALAHQRPRVRELLVFRMTQAGAFDDAIARAAARWGLDPFVCKALLISESNLDPNAVGKRRYAVVRGRRRVISGGALGIAQFTRSGIRGLNRMRRRRAPPGAVVETFTAADAMRAEKAIPAAVELLSYLVRDYGRDGGLTAYNTGIVGGRLVKRYGFWNARRSGRLARAGAVLLQGERFLLKVLRRANRLRVAAGLPPLPPPGGAPGRGRTLPTS